MIKNYMLKNCEMFVTLDESFSGSVGSANNSESKINGKGRAEFCMYKDIEKKAKKQTETRLQEELNFSDPIEKFL